MIQERQESLLMEQFGNNKHLVSRLLACTKKQSVRKRFCKEVRAFSISLHFYSPKAYSYVRETFNKCLPHPRTLPKWYSVVDAKPGFSSEALELLKLRASKTEKPILCSLVWDEMSIRQHLEYDGTNYSGYVNMGCNNDNEYSEIASQALVFMVVPINQSWKIPVGYFFIKSLTSEQKTALVEQ